MASGKNENRKKNALVVKLPARPPPRVAVKLVPDNKPEYYCKPENRGPANMAEKRKN